MLDFFVIWALIAHGRDVKWSQGRPGWGWACGTARHRVTGAAPSGSPAAPREGQRRLALSGTIIKSARASAPAPLRHAPDIGRCDPPRPRWQAERRPTRPATDTRSSSQCRDDDRPPPVPIPDANSAQYSSSTINRRLRPRLAIITPLIYQECCDRYWNPPV